MSDVPDIKYDSFYLYDELTAFLKQCQQAQGNLFQLESLVKTPEGRDVWLATITDPATGPAADKPAYFVQANMHANEMYGTTAALHLIHTLLTDDPALQTLKELTFYVVPRVTPDAAEYSLTYQGPVRSRVEISDKTNSLIPEDLDGDGIITNMRWEDPLGPYTEDPQDPRIMVRRRPGDKGPFYQQYKEGTIHNYDGGPIVSYFKWTDFNRNYPSNWDFNTDVATYPFAHPETKALGTFLLTNHNIFAGIDFHGGTPAVLRPSPSTPDNDMNQSDMGLIMEIGKLAAEMTGFNLMNVRDYRASWEKPIILHGDSNDFAYFQLGISWYVIELGWGLSSAGIGPDQSFDADPQTRDRDFRRRMMKFADDADVYKDRDIFVPWSEIDHPQLGKVEVGGMTTASSHIYPPQMEEISTRTTQFLLKHATYHPQIAMSSLQADKVGPGVYRIRGNVANIGRMDTNVMSTGISSRITEPVRVTLQNVDTQEILSRPHFYEFAALKGGGGSEQLEWFVTAKPAQEITVKASNPRAGIAKATVTLP